MLSYQHIYHAGGPADLHKHALLCLVLDGLRRRCRILTYMETHAGRGLYDLGAKEAAKTGEAARGWLAAAASAEGLEALPRHLVEVVRGLNGGATGPLYPGSPMIAAKMLRRQDKIHLMELHPREHAALAETFRGDDRVTIDKRDGYEGVLSLCPPPHRRGLVLIDPSYEIKDEYGIAASFVATLRTVWPEAVVMLWYPLLAAGRHEDMLEHLARRCPQAIRNEVCWAKPEAGGMYGSGIVLLNFSGFLPGFVDAGA